LTEKFLPRALLLAGLLVATECGGPEPFNSLAITTGAGGSGPGAAGVSGSAGIGGATGTAGAGGDSATGGVNGLAGASGLAGSAGAAGNSGNADGSGTAGTGAGGVGGGTAGAGGVGGGAAGTNADAGSEASAGSGGAAGGAAGAAGAPPDAGPPVNYCDRSHWTATASASYTMAPAGPPIQGIDGNLTTRWTSGHSQNGTDYYQVDFGGTVKLTKITLDDTGDNSAADFPLMYQVYGSTDGTTFGATPFITGSGTANSTMITFPEQTVRAVKIRELGAKAEWWSIGEFQTVCSL
jgi:hypothetical protein